MSLWFRCLFLFSSYGPLYLILCVGLAVQDIEGGAIAAGGAFIISVVVFLKLRAGFRLKSPFRSKVNAVEALDDSILAYLISYLPPLMIDDYKRLDKLLPVAAFYSFTTLMLLRSNSVYVNPFFLIFGYRIFRVKLPSKRTAIVITKNNITDDDLLNLYEIEPAYLYFAD